MRERVGQTIETEQLRASHVFNIGAEIRNVSSICCLLSEIICGQRPCAVPTTMDVQNHAMSSSTESDSCPCCSVDKLLDLDGDILGDFPEWESLPVDKSIRKSALTAIVEEADKVLDRLEAMMAVEAGKEKEEAEELASMLRGESRLQSMLRQVSPALQWLIKKPKCIRLRRRAEKEPVGNPEDMSAIATAA